MSTVTKTQATSTYRSPSQAKKTSPFVPQNGDQTFLFDKTNYMLMIGGILVILLGFALMAGGKSPDPHQFNYDEIYSFRRITLAPVVVFLGFVMEIYAIMKKPADAANTVR